MGEKNQINNIRNENGEITTDNTEIKRSWETTMSNYMSKKKKKGQFGRNGQNSLPELKQEK